MQERFENKHHLKNIYIIYMMNQINEKRIW